MQIHKKIIALTIASALTAPALALADTSIYGVFDVGYGQTKETAGSTQTSQELDSFGFSTMTSSRLGFMNTEDLSGGMKSMVKIETGISSNVMAGTTESPAGTPDFTKGSTLAATTLGDRELNASLMFSQGTTIKLGYGSTLIRDISLGYAPDPGGNLVGNILNNQAAFGSNRAVGATVTQAFDKGSVAIQLTDKTTKVSGDVDNKSGNGYLIGGQYADGAVSVAAAYQDQESIAGTVAATSDATRKIGIIAGSYDFGVAKLIAEYGTNKTDDSVSGLSAKVDGGSIGVQAPFGDVLGFVQLSHGTANDGADGDQTVSGYTIGGKYNISKATYGYVSFGENKMDAGTGAAYQVKVDQFAFGLVKTF
jgi:Gram-negative porin